MEDSGMDTMAGKTSRHRTNSIDRDGAARPEAVAAAPGVSDVGDAEVVRSGEWFIQLRLLHTIPFDDGTTKAYYGKRNLPSCATRMNPSPAGSCGVAARRVWG
ncbi:hypothetical protein CKAH01_14564 [Colletotrichum kahawae]|uniref:Uncharacterized protein n=1 Tax=Colletotrichum kahawae TaxID=34407 RepID=A0AAD9YM75_COLKA|nr:hypothetical protein CKAH01_14564 [Colletotrichum kahawae]